MGGSSIYQGAGEGKAWEQVRLAYLRDELPAAMALIETLGIGHAGRALMFSRSVEAEFLSAKGARTFSLGPEAEVELEERFEGIVATYLRMQYEEAIESVQSRLGVVVDPPVRLTLLVPEADAPWTPGRHGFCIPKQDYYKICLPAALLNDEPELDVALRHEYTHALAGFLAGEALPTWLHEALAMRMGGHVSMDYITCLQSGSIRWMDAAQLEQAFHADRETDHGATLIRDAYQQARVVSDYLCSLKGEQGLGECLMAYTDNSFWTDLKLRTTGASETDEALGQTYGLNTKSLFAAAKAWIRARG